MDISNVLIALIICCAIWNVIATLIIYGALKRRKIPVHFVWLRALAPKYAFQYRSITKAETGKIGALFYHWIISINLALIFTIGIIIAGL